MTKRIKLFIIPKLQIKYVGIVIFFFIIISAYLSVDIFYYLKDITPNFDSAAQKNIVRMYFGLGIKIMLLTIIFSFLGLYITSRIAGPIYRLAKDIIKMAENADLTVSFHLREKDELHQVSEALNHMTTMLRSRLINDDEFREKVRITAKAMIHILQNNRNVSDSEKEKLVKAGNLLLKESSQFQIKFKI